MRTTLAVAGTALAAALVCAVNWTAAGTARAVTRPEPAASAPATGAAACYAFAVKALRQRVVVRRMPSACAGLGAEQVNETVARAIRTVVGPLPKAAARHQAVAYSRFLASLVRTARPPRAAPAATGEALPSSSLPPRLAALGAWLAAVIAGGYLLAGRLTWQRRRPWQRWRRARLAGVSWWVAGGHAGLATAGLIGWIAFIATAMPVIGWIDAALTWLIAGLGMATLLADAPEPDAATAAAESRNGPAAPQPRSARPPVVTIALHGALATVTIVLVLVAVIGVG